MRFITLVRVPGDGASDVQIQDGWTLGDLASAQNLFNRALYIRGVLIPNEQWSSTSLADVTEVFATAAVKGA